MLHLYIVILLPSYYLLLQNFISLQEVIHDMKAVTKVLLLKFHAANKGRKPEKIIMYRDGVSEGQFLTGGL